jgi:xanthine/CO dehydrogenase XdhC/CoxF family maturation factor
MNDASREIAAEVLKAAREGPPVVVATIIAAPETAVAALGAKLLVREDGSSLGDYGGGVFESTLTADCVEALTEFPRRPVQALYYRLTLGSVVSASPKSRSNTTRGLFCVGRGVLALFQTIVLVYGHA